MYRASAFNFSGTRVLRSGKSLNHSSHHPLPEAVETRLYSPLSTSIDLAVVILCPRPDALYSKLKFIEHLNAALSRIWYSSYLAEVPLCKGSHNRFIEISHLPVHDLAPNAPSKPLLYR